MSETDPLTRQPEWMIPDVGKKAQSSFSRERTFNVLKSSTPKTSPPVDNAKDSLTAAHELSNAGQVPPQTGSTENHEYPFKGLTRLPPDSRETQEGASRTKTTEVVQLS